jgi:hypothetical protein
MPKGRMTDSLPADLLALLTELDAADHDLEALTSDLADSVATRRPATGGWCVTECIDHLATANDVYVTAMRGPALRALEGGRRRRGPARPGVLGGLFVWMLEPPPRWWAYLPMPRKLAPGAAPPLTTTLAKFRTSQDAIRAFIRQYAAVDLAGVTFPNPFLRGVRFTLATGLNVLTAHERRHLLQAWKARRSAEGTQADRGDGAA